MVIQCLHFANEFLNQTIIDTAWDYTSLVSMQFPLHFLFYMCVRYGTWVSEGEGERSQSWSCAGHGMLWIPSRSTILMVFITNHGQDVINPDQDLSLYSSQLLHIHVYIPPPAHASFRKGERERERESPGDKDIGLHLMHAKCLSLVQNFTCQTKTTCLILCPFDSGFI